MSSRLYERCGCGYRLPQKCWNSCLVRRRNLKYRALRLDTGNFAWGSESVARKTRIISVVRSREIARMRNSVTDLLVRRCTTLPTTNSSERTPSQSLLSCRSTLRRSELGTRLTTVCRWVEDDNRLKRKRLRRRRSARACNTSMSCD